MNRLRLAELDRRVPVRVWLLVVAGGLLVWIVPAVAMGVKPYFVDWQIYREAAALWHATGSPYATPPPSWDPDVYHPYLYPPTSWPFLAIVDLVPAGLLALGLLPFLAVRPRRWASPAVALLLFAAAAPTILLGNVNALIAGSLVVAFLPGIAGGIGLAVAVAFKAYPIVLLPLLWRDRRRMLAAAALLGFLALSGTIVWGPGSWAAWLQALSTEGSYVDSLNPLSGNRPASLAVAVVGLLVGFVLGSPTLVLGASLFASPAIYVHYLLTVAAGLVGEPPLAGRSRRWRVGWLRRPDPDRPDDAAAP
jgi:hypothetical protein